MTLIDSSSWIHALRPKGDPEVTDRVRRLLEGGEAAWCSMVRLELWNGARGDHEKRVLRDLERSLPEYAITEEVWQQAFDLARVARKQGKTVPATDLLIAACARTYGLALEHSDPHFETLARLSC